MVSSENSSDSLPTESIIHFDVKNEDDTFMIVWLVNLLELVIEISGLTLNGLVYDSSLQLPLTSGSIWMRYLAVCDNVFLAVAAANCVTKFFKINLATVNNFCCKMFIFLTVTTKLNATSHLAAFALDRVVSLKFPIWHYGKNWSNIVRHVF